MRGLKRVQAQRRLPCLELVNFKIIQEVIIKWVIGSLPCSCNNHAYSYREDLADRLQHTTVGFCGWFLFELSPGTAGT